MRENSDAWRRTLRVGGIVIAGATQLGVITAAAENAARSVTSGASHEIVMRMSVPVSCRMTTSASQIRLTGKADDGGAIDTTLSGQGGLVVDCNTPYAMTLARTPLFAAPARKFVEEPSRQLARQLRDVEPAASGNDVQVAHMGLPGPVAAQLQRLAEVTTPQLGEEMTVVVRVDGRSAPMESSCVLAQGASAPFVCHAFAGPEDLRLPPPRASASLIVTGAVERPEAATGSDEYEAGPALLPAVSDGQSTAMSVSDTNESAMVRRARERVVGKKIGDRLTVSLSARY